VPLGQAVWESHGCKWATLWTALYTIATFVCFVHSPVIGSYWCPFSRCAAAEEALLAETHRELNIESEILGGACLFFDVFVIWYHLNNPVHPKFLVSRTRKAVIFTHIISGSVQCIVGPVLLALWLAGVSPAAVMWLKAALVVWCGLFHVTTASFLARTPFGEVRVMLPAFIFVIGMYCYTLANLLVATYENMEVPLLAWWLMTHIYVMNRIIFAVLARFSLLVESRYAWRPPCARPSQPPPAARALRAGWRTCAASAPTRRQTLAPCAKLSFGNSARPFARRAGTRWRFCSARRSAARLRSAARSCSS
jgi:hypothetical protein